MNLPKTGRSSEGPHSHIKLVFAIPARLGSTRLPRKPLAKLGNKPLIAWVAERVSACVRATAEKLKLTSEECLTIVATDSPEIAAVVDSLKVRTVMTPADLPSGTDRIQYALRQLPADTQARFSASTLVINLQGDEPFFASQDITNLASAMFSDPTLPMGTLAFPQTDAMQFFRSSVVKVVCDAQRLALYFSRAPIPWPRTQLGASLPIHTLQLDDTPQLETPFLQHVGVYAYRLAALETYTQLPPGRLEQLEGLEQLRALEAGMSIAVVLASEPPFGIDTPEDLLRAETHLSHLEQNP